MEVVPWLIDSTETMLGQSAPGFVPAGACSGYPVAVAASSLLQGPYDPTSGLMRDQLRAAGLIPYGQPYGPIFGYAGQESVTLQVLQVTGPNAIVDWVLLEVRSGVAPHAVLASRAALLQRDGDIVEVDGVSPVRVWQAPRGFHNVAVRHRNHLGAMSLSPIYFGMQEPGIVDLITNPTYGNNARRLLANGVSVLWCGNTRGDGVLKYTGPGNDRDPILLALPATSASSVRTNVYNNADTNLDGSVKYSGSANDRDPILVNIGGTSPTSVRVQQLP